MLAGPSTRGRAVEPGLRVPEAGSGALVEGAPDGTHRSTVGDDGSSARPGRQRSQRRTDLGHHAAGDDALRDEPLGLPGVSSAMR